MHFGSSSPLDNALVVTSRDIDMKFSEVEGGRPWRPHNERRSEERYMAPRQAATFYLVLLRVVAFFTIEAGRGTV